jgi:hypothetical protein
MRRLHVEEDAVAVEMHAPGPRFAFEHEHAGHDLEDFAIQLLGAEIDRTREGAFHHIDVMAKVAQVHRLGRRRCRRGRGLRSCRRRTRQDRESEG